MYNVYIFNIVLLNKRNVSYRTYNVLTFLSSDVTSQVGIMGLILFSIL